MKRAPAGMTTIGRLSYLEGLVRALRDEFTEFQHRVAEHMTQEAGEATVLDRIETNLAENTTRTNEMYAIFQPAASGLRAIGNVASVIGAVISATGRALGRVIQFLGWIAKPIFWIIALGAAIWTGLTTGHFQIPEWWSKLP